MWGRCSKGIHKYEPRYDLRWPDQFPWSRLNRLMGGIEDLREEIYVRDVCVRCGKTIERGAE